jgi:hypothetical protein
MELADGSFVFADRREVAPVIHMYTVSGIPRKMRRFVSVTVAKTGSYLSHGPFGTGWDSGTEKFFIFCREIWALATVSRVYRTVCLSTRGCGHPGGHLVDSGQAWTADDRFVRRFVWFRLTRYNFHLLFYLNI